MQTVTHWYRGHISSLFSKAFTNRNEGWAVSDDYVLDKEEPLTSGAADCFLSIPFKLYCYMLFCRYACMNFA